MIYKPNDKSESMRLIEHLDLNRFPEKICHKSMIDGIKRFLLEYPAPLYVLRNPITPNSPYYYFETFDQLPNLLERFPDTIMISVSLNGYRDKKILLGTIEIGEDSSIRLTATKNNQLDHRTVNTNPDYDFEISFDDKHIINTIPGLNNLIDYITNYNLFNLAIEFTIFNTPLGVKNDIIVITEIRSEY